MSLFALVILVSLDIFWCTSNKIACGHFWVMMPSFSCSQPPRLALSLALCASVLGTNARLCNFEALHEKTTVCKETMSGTKSVLSHNLALSHFESHNLLQWFPCSKQLKIMTFVKEWHLFPDHNWNILTSMLVQHELLPASQSNHCRCGGWFQLLCSTLSCDTLQIFRQLTGCHWCG